MTSNQKPNHRIEYRQLPPGVSKDKAGGTEDVATNEEIQC